MLDTCFCYFPHSLFSNPLGTPWNTSWPFPSHLSSSFRVVQSVIFLWPSKLTYLNWDYHEVSKEKYFLLGSYSCLKVLVVFSSKDLLKKIVQKCIFSIERIHEHKLNLFRNWVSLYQMQRHHRAMLMSKVHQKNLKVMMRMVVVTAMMMRLAIYSLHWIQVQKRAVH